MSDPFCAQLVDSLPNAIYITKLARMYRDTESGRPGFVEESFQLGDVRETHLIAG